VTAPRVAHTWTKEAQEHNSLWLIRDAEGWPLFELRHVLVTEGGLNDDRAAKDQRLNTLLAAPDLLAACKAALDTMDTLEANYSVLGISVPGLATELRAAIARVEAS
jgi:hypothetical protein